MLQKTSAASSGNHLEVLDRVLDKGIVIDAWMRVSVAGIDLITVSARVLVASIETYARYSNLLPEAAVASQSDLLVESPSTPGRTGR